jgi:predicted metal-dependent phosphoesterase TrpH
MMDKGYISNVKEGFDKYMSVGKYAYCEKQRLTARDAIELIAKCGGISFLAHPHLTKLPDDELVEFLEELKRYGLCGLEGYYTDYTPEMQERYQAMAKELGLVISGGTDYHGANKPHIAIGKGKGNLEIPYSVLDGLRERHAAIYK